VRSACPQPARVGTRVRAGRCGAETRSEPLVGVRCYRRLHPQRAGTRIAPGRRGGDVDGVPARDSAAQHRHSAARREAVEWSPASKLHPVRTALARAEATASPPAVAPFKPLLQACVRRAALWSRPPTGTVPALSHLHCAHGHGRAARRGPQRCALHNRPELLGARQRLHWSREGAPSGHRATSRHFSLLLTEEALIYKVRTACSASRSGASGGARRDDDHTSLTQLALSRPPNEAGRGAETLFTLFTEETLAERRNACMHTHARLARLRCLSSLSTTP
jgi:hypothetical protein